MGVQLFHADRQTDRQTDMTYSLFAAVSKCSVLHPPPQIKKSMTERKRERNLPNLIIDTC